MIGEAVDLFNQKVEMPLVFDGSVQLCKSLRMFWRVEQNLCTDVLGRLCTSAVPSSAALMTAFSNKKSIMTAGWTLFTIVPCSFWNLSLNTSFDSKRILTNIRRLLKFLFKTRECVNVYRPAGIFPIRLLITADILVDQYMHYLNFFLWSADAGRFLRVGDRSTCRSIGGRKFRTQNTEFFGHETACVCVFCGAENIS